MKVNVNRRCAHRPLKKRFSDGSLVLCRVDNFPADNPQYVKEDGFRRSDISLLDRMSFGMQVDDDMLRIVSSRVREIKSQPANNLSESQLIATLRPAWVQTAAEIKSYDEAVYQFMNTTADVKDVQLKSDDGARDGDASSEPPSSPAPAE